MLSIPTSVQKKNIDAAFAWALRNNVSNLEVMLTQGSSRSIRWQKKNIDTAKMADSQGVGIRIIEKGRTGYSFTENLEKTAIENCCQTAHERSQWGKIVEGYELKNHPQLVSKGPSFTFSEALVPVEQLVKLAQDIESSIFKSDKRVSNIPELGVGYQTESTLIANSKGMVKSEESGRYFTYSYVSMQGKADIRSGGESFWSYRFADFQSESIADKVVQKTALLIDAGKAAAGKCAVILNNEVVAQLLSVFSDAFSAKRIINKTSPFKEKYQQALFAESVNIYDDALLPNGANSRYFDSEGVDSTALTLVEKGILKNFFHNTETALKLNQVSTGHGARSYRGSLGIAPSNLWLAPGNGEPVQMRSSHTNVIEVLKVQGHAGSSILTGDFSLGCEGLHYLNGKFQGPVANFTIAGNFYDLLNNSLAIGNDLYRNNSGVGAPSILCELTIGV